MVVTSLDNASRQTNAIDPTVVVDKSGAHWMYYGSAWDGIYKLELNPTTGLAFRNEDKGVRVAQRGFTGNKINGNLEGPEIIYNPEFDMYYLFLAYDWLQTKYNVRVGRSKSATGPFYDLNGRDLNEEVDDAPMILAPYRFGGHQGWQGVSHVGIFEDKGKYYMGHQGRPVENSFYMLMHLRQLFWTEDGWPLVSPERYAAEEESVIEKTEIPGTWEWIHFSYQVVPGYADEQTNAGLSSAEQIEIHSDGSVTGAVQGNWTYSTPWLQIQSLDGNTFKLRMERGRDWEKKVEKTLLLTGLDKEGMAIWAKKI